MLKQPPRARREHSSVAWSWIPSSRTDRDARSGLPPYVRNRSPRPRGCRAFTWAATSAIVVSASTVSASVRPTPCQSHHAQRQWTRARRMGPASRHGHARCSHRSHKDLHPAVEAAGSKLAQALGDALPQPTATRRVTGRAQAAAWRRRRGDGRGSAEPMVDAFCLHELVESKKHRVGPTGCLCARVRPTRAFIIYIFLSFEFVYLIEMLFVSVLVNNIPV